METELRGLSLLLLLLLLVLAFQAKGFQGFFRVALAVLETCTVDSDGLKLKGDLPTFVVSAGIKDLCHRPSYSPTPSGDYFQRRKRTKKKKEKEKY